MPVHSPKQKCSSNGCGSGKDLYHLNCWIWISIQKRKPDPDLGVKKVKENIFKNIFFFTFIVFFKSQNKFKIYKNKKAVGIFFTGHSDPVPKFLGKCWMQTRI